MRRTIIAALMIGLMSLLTNTRSSYAETPEKTTPDKVLQLANDFCSQLNRSQTTAETTTNKASQLANDFCSQLSQAQTSSQPTRLALAQTSSQPTTLALAEVPGQQPADKTVATGPDWSLTLGYKLWLNTWQQVVPPLPRNSLFNVLTGVNLKSTDAFRPALIPSVTFRYKDFLLSTGVLIAPRYHFESFTDIVGFGNPTPPPPIVSDKVRFEISGRRTDVDVTGGYYVFPAVALLVGYKGVYQNFTLDTTSALSPPNTTHQRVKYHGVTFGAAVAVPIPEGGGLPSGFGLYLTGGGGPMWASISNPESSDTPTAIYGTIEGGVTYRPVPWPVSFLLGYKYQGISNKVSGKSGVDATRGAILGVNYTF